MNTESIDQIDVVEDKKDELGVVKLNVTDTAIAEFKKKYLSLKVNGIEDKAGLKAVYEARQEVKKVRVSAVKYASELKEKALAWQKKVNTEKDRVVDELEAIESYLQGEEDKIEAEKQRIKQEAIDAENARKAAEQKAAQDKIDAENKRIADEKAELKRQQDLQMAREEAAEAARIRAVEEAKTAERNRLEAESAAKIEAARLAALQPDKDKLLLIADDVSVFMNNYNKVSFKSDQSKEIFNQVALMMSKVETHIRTKVKSL